MKNKTNYELIQLLIIPIGVAINVVGYQLCTILKLPLFLDVIGTAIAALTGGPLVGAITGGLGNLVNGMFNPTAIPYAIVSICMGTAIGLFAKYSLLKTKKGIATLIITLSFIGPITATPITVLMFGGATGTGVDFITAVIAQTGQGIWSSVFSQSFLVGIVNNMVNLSIAYYIISKMSNRYLHKTNYGANYIKEAKNYSIDGEEV